MSEKLTVELVPAHELADGGDFIPLNDTKNFPGAWVAPTLNWKGGFPIDHFGGG